MKVKLLEVDQRGKVRLSMRLVDQETGEELPDTRPPREPREGGDRGPRGDRGDRGRGGRDRGPRRDGDDADRAVKAAVAIAIADRVVRPRRSWTPARARGRGEDRRRRRRPGARVRSGVPDWG